MTCIGIYRCQCGHQIERTTSLPMVTPHQIRSRRRACANHICPACAARGVESKLKRLRQ